MSPMSSQGDLLLELEYWTARLDRARERQDKDPETAEREITSLRRRIDDVSNDPMSKYQKGSFDAYMEENPRKALNVIRQCLNKNYRIESNGEIKRIHGKTYKELRASHRGE